MNQITPIKYLLSTVIFALSFLAVNPVLAQQKKIIMKKSSADTTEYKVKKVKKVVIKDASSNVDSVVVVGSLKTDETDPFADIDPDEIESVNVTAEGDKKTVVIKMKNGETIEREITSSGSSAAKTRTMVVEVSDDEDELVEGAHMVFMTDGMMTVTADEEDIATLFPELDKEDIEEVTIEIDNGKKTTKVTTKDGQKYEKVTEVKGMKTASWSSDDQKMFKIHTMSTSSDKKIQELEERLKRMEEKLDLLLKKISDQ